MIILAVAFWLAGAIYSAFCLWAPEMRPHYRGGFIAPDAEMKFGLVTCIGMALTFWLPALVYIATGLLPGLPLITVYLAACLGILVCSIGSLIDIFG